MGSIRIHKGMEMSEEQKKRIDSMRQLSDEEIDFSDIPPLTDEQLARMKRVHPLPNKIKKVAN